MRDPAKKLAAYRSWCKANPDKVRAARKRARLKTPDHVVRDRSYRHNYGISYDEVLQIYKDQEGMCAVCDDDLVWPSKKTHLDHCHRTGRVRGLLCASCNAMIGYAKDDVFNLRRAIAYLNWFRRSPE